MNDARRQIVNGIIYRQQQITKDLRALETAEQKALDNMPSGLKTKPTIKRVQRALDRLDEVAVYSDDIISVLKMVK